MNDITQDEVRKEKRRKRTPLEGAWRKGRLASLAGKLESDCPYVDKRKDDGRLTWSRAFIAAWLDGYRLHSPGVRSCDPDPHEWEHDGSSGYWCVRCFVSKRDLNTPKYVDVG